MTDRLRVSMVGSSIVLDYFRGEYLHRDGGPAFINVTMKSFHWFQNGRVHRADGPAMMRYGSADRYRMWRDAVIDASSLAAYRWQIGMEFWYDGCSVVRPNHDPISWIAENCHGQISLGTGKFFLNSDDQIAFAAEFFSPPPPNISFSLTAP